MILYKNVSVPFWIDNKELWDIVLKFFLRKELKFGYEKSVFMTARRSLQGPLKIDFDSLG